MDVGPHLLAAFEHSPTATLLTTPEGSVLLANPAACELLGRTESELRAIGPFGIVDPADPRLEAALETRGEQGWVLTDLTLLRGDGSRFVGEVTAALWQGPAGAEMSSMIIRDVTSDREALERVRLLAELAQEGISVQQDGRIVEVNPAFERLLGYSAEEAVGVEGTAFVAPESRPLVVEKMREGSEEPYEVIAVRKDGSHLVCEVRARNAHYRGLPARVVAVRDVTERKREEERVSFLAYHDALTGLPNRTLFEEHLALAVARADRERRAVAVLYVDLDGFKRVNDTCGHAIGDEVFRVVADRLRECARASDVVARHGGDEFLVLVGDLARRICVPAAEGVALRIEDALSVPFEVPGGPVACSASVGFAIYPQHAKSSNGLVHAADAAMYERKRARRVAA